MLTSALSLFLMFSRFSRKLGLLKEVGLLLAFLSFTSGCPPCVWRRNRHGDGALHPGRSRLRHQSLLLWLHPERRQVHLPQEVCTGWPQRSVSSHLAQIKNPENSSLFLKMTYLKVFFSIALKWLVPPRFCLHLICTDLNGPRLYLHPPSTTAA